MSDEIRLDFFQVMDKNWPDWELPLLRDYSYVKSVDRKQTHLDSKIGIIVVDLGKLSSQMQCDESFDDILLETKLHHNGEFAHNSNDTVILEFLIDDIVNIV